MKRLIYFILIVLLVNLFTYAHPIETPEDNLSLTAYSLDPAEVKKVMDEKMKGQPYNEEQFLFYHLHRNYFNVKDEVNSLERLGKRKYRDNLGNLWTEASIKNNFFHMPKVNWFLSLIRWSRPYSRKFHRNDTTSGLGGVFEMVIRHDGKRIDALIHDAYQETYNYAPPGNNMAHKILDVDPHTKNTGYTFKMDLGYVTIKD